MGSFLKPNEQIIATTAIYFSELFLLPAPPPSTLSTPPTTATTTAAPAITSAAAAMAETRTPMAWQHRDMNYQTQRGDVSPSRRFTPTPNSRYGGPPTPNSAHSRHSRTPDHRRNERGSSSDR